MKIRAVAALAVAGAMIIPAPASAQDPAVVERFDGGSVPAGWRTVDGEWSVAGGRLVGRSASSAQNARITFGPHLENYRVELTLRFENVAEPTRWTAIGLDMPQDGSVPWWHAALRSGSTATNGVEFAERTAANAWNVTDRGAAPTAAGTGRDVDVAIEVHGNRADWVEIDVATSADGVPYVLHDNTVDRTTPGTGALPSLQSSYLDTLEAGSWFTPAFTG